MATHRVSILNNVLPDTTGDVYPESYIVKGSNDVWKGDVWIFNDTATRIGLYGFFEVPMNYVGTAKLVLVWTSAGVSGDVEWDFDYRAVTGNDSESMDQSGTQESVNLNDAAPGAAHRRLECIIDLTSANLAAGATLEFVLFRDGTDGGDGLATAAILFDALLQYSDG